MNKVLESQAQGVQTPAQSPAQNSTKVPPKVVAAYACCAVVWGTTWYAIRVCIGPGGYAIYPAIALRFTIAASILALVWLALRKKLIVSDPKRIPWIAIAGCISSVGFAFLYTAEQHVSGGLAAVISALNPLATALIAMVTRTEKPTRTTLIGSALAFIGVAMVFHDRVHVSPEQGTAVGLLLLSVCCAAGSNVVLKRNMATVPSVVTNAVFCSSISVFVWGVALVGRQSALPLPHAPEPTIALFYLAIMGTLIALGSFLYLLKNVRLSTATTLAFVTPTVAVLIDSIFERQVVLSTESYLGMAVVLSGVAATVFLKDKTVS